MTAVEELKQIVARLRGPGGCPWDQEQDHRSLAVCLIEECSELLDTIDRLDMEHMREELGDVLLQVVFHAQLAEEAGHFDLEAVAAEVNEKLVRRHPHVFGDNKLSTSDEVLTQWEQIKAGEKKSAGAQMAASAVFKRLPPRLPALLYAHDVYKQIVKRELPADGSVDREAVRLLADGLSEADAGRRFFELAAACREAGIDPESALRRHADNVMTVVSEAAGATRDAEG